MSAFFGDLDLDLHRAIGPLPYSGLTIWFSGFDLDYGIT